MSSISVNEKNARITIETKEMSPLYIFMLALEQKNNEYEKTKDKLEEAKKEKNQRQIYWNAILVK